MPKNNPSNSKDKDTKEIDTKAPENAPEISHFVISLEDMGILSDTFNEAIRNKYVKLALASLINDVATPIMK